MQNKQTLGFTKLNSRVTRLTVRTLLVQNSSQIHVKAMLLSIKN